MSESITKTSSCLKAIIKGFYKNGEVVTEGSLKGFVIRPSEDQCRICAKIAHLVMDNNGFFKPDTKYWLTGLDEFNIGSENKYTKRSRINLIFLFSVAPLFSLISSFQSKKNLSMAKIFHD